MLFACGFEQKRGEITAVVIGTDFISTVIHGVVDTDTSGKKEWNSRGKKTLEIHKGLVFCADFIQLQEGIVLMSLPMSLNFCNYNNFQLLF